MSWKTLLRALGKRELARRLGITPATLQRWIRAGKPSTKGQQKLQEIAERRRRSLKGQKTKVERAAFRERLSMPDHPAAASSAAPFGAGYLTPEQVLPRKKPVETAAELRRVRETAGEHGETFIRTDLYNGESRWIPVGKPLAEVDMDEITDEIVSVWHGSDRTWAQVVALLFRFIPWNPFYDSEMVKKSGKWFPFWISTPIGAKLRDIAMAVRLMFKKSLRAAKERMIWLEAVKVNTFDIKPGPPNLRRWRQRPLRAT